MDFYCFQAFVKFSVGDREIFYVAEVDGTEVYKVEIDVSKVASDFNQISGLYDVVGTHVYIIICASGLLRWL